MSEVVSDVVVLLATFNGEEFLERQLDSIYSQKDVSVTVYVRDDGSTDKTVAIIKSYPAPLGRLVVLESTKNGGSAALNFLEMILHIDVQNKSCICFADQDDIWLPYKLRTALNRISEGYDLYSSSLTAFSEGKDNTSNIKGKVIFKKFDYLFQGLSAGCTYVLSPSFFTFVQKKIVENKLILEAGFSHDWLIYTLARSHEYTIYHDKNSYILYRQHANNVQGSLRGLRGVLYRSKNIWENWYYDQIMFNRNFIKNTSDEVKILNALESKNIRFLIRNCLQFRRSFLECIALLIFSLLRKRND